MSRTISIVNAGNVYAQTFLKKLSGYNRIILGDCVNSRRSVKIKIKIKLYNNCLLLKLVPEISKHSKTIRQKRSSRAHEHQLSNSPRRVNQTGKHSGILHSRLLRLCKREKWSTKKNSGDLQGLQCGEINSSEPSGVCELL